MCRNPFFMLGQIRKPVVKRRANRKKLKRVSNTLPLVDNMKDLGFMITHILSSNSHIDHKLATARKYLSFSEECCIQLFYCEKETALSKSYFVCSFVRLSSVVSLFHVYCSISCVYSNIRC